MSTNGKIEPLQEPSNQTKAKKILSNLVSSVGDLINDITALEINTMVVSQIKGNKFNPWEAYQAIYSINDKDYFQEKGIPEKSLHGQTLHDRYKSLFTQMEREYFHLLVANNNPAADEKIIRYQKRLQFLKQQKNGVIIESDPKYIELAQPILPSPSPVLDTANVENPEQQEKLRQAWKRDIQEIQDLLGNDKFVRALRKIIELKSALDSGDITSNNIDIIYAQTVMQLDGDIITRYHKELFNLPEEAKTLIITTHNEGIVSGEKQWRGTFSFLVDLIKGIANVS